MYTQVSSLFAGINEYAYLLHSSVEGKVKSKNILYSILMSRPYLRRKVSLPLPGAVVDFGIGSLGFQ